MFFGVKRERELFVLSEGLVKTSDDVFRGMHPPKKNLAFAQKQTKQGKKAKLLSVSFPLFFSLFSLQVSSQQKTSSHLSQLLSFSSF
tara:strand:+ start:346 stop:606 length:261 start_codon:yes stop_codon:yes gene_type:complete